MATTATETMTVEYITDDQMNDIVDRRARRQFGISGAEFARRYRAGDLEEFEPAAVFHLGVLLPPEGEFPGERENP